VSRGIVSGDPALATRDALKDELFALSGMASCTRTVHIDGREHVVFWPSMPAIVRLLYWLDAACGGRLGVPRHRCMPTVAGRRLRPKVRLSRTGFPVEGVEVPHEIFLARLDAWVACVLGPGRVPPVRGKYRTSIDDLRAAVRLAKGLPG